VKAYLKNITAIHGAIVFQPEKAGMEEAEAKIASWFAPKKVQVTKPLAF